ncbi:MAG: prepilin-type N-terminal cleavage/methylation domain-containing protein [Candidatus Magasanikbacteria bacterium]
MQKLGGHRGFTLVEVVVATAVFLIFAVGVYGSISMVFKVVYQSRVKILETAVLSEELEIVRNLPYEDVGILNGSPLGLLSHTKSVYRNDIKFNLVTTVRNIDDPFDGVIGGTPNDTSPADFKLVEISVICDSCSQKNPVSLSTTVAPKNLEGQSTNGALFIHVFDADGQAVSSANVHIVNSAVSPNLIIDDVTDNDGMLRLVDTPTGTLSYNITVTKAGYSTDSSVVSSVDNPNPLKPPSNVVSQNVTEISFSIDRLATLNVESLNQTCSSINGGTVNINGAKIVGTDPNVYKLSQTFSLASGNYNFGSIEEDSYYFNLPGTTYDIAGSVPMLPLALEPGSQQVLSLILRPHTTNSLLVKAKDAGTGLPLSDASVRLVGTSYDETIQTSLGYVRQTDWSGGSGQVLFTVENKYFSDNGGVTKTSGDLTLKKSGNYYAVSGILESSTFDLGEGLTYRNIIWEPLSQLSQTGVNPIVFQLAASSSSSPAVWNFTGPDGMATSYYTVTNTIIHSSLNNKRYLRYKAFLSTEKNRYTPTLSEVAITFTNECTPPGQVFFSGLSAGTYTLTVSKDGYTTNSGDIDISGRGESVVNMSPL